RSWARRSAPHARRAARRRHLRAIVTAGDKVTKDLVKKAEAKLDELATKVGLVTLAITPDGTTTPVKFATPMGEAARDWAREWFDQVSESGTALDQQRRRDDLARVVQGARWSTRRHRDQL